MSRIQEEESLKELASLADTAGADVVEILLQDRRALDPATFIGTGKVHQVSRRVDQTHADIVIFDEDLTPVQMKNLAKAIHRKILDRSGLILDIFARRARSRESQIQVELAQLQYFLPRLTRQWTHLSRQEGGIGTRGPGETQLEVDRRAVRRRIAGLKKELEKIELQRRVRRKARKKFRKVSLVGYTNVGKSSLLNTLTDAEVFVENRLFATLDATIRLLPYERASDILLIDTVGFIRKLPHHLVASFRSTLEETRESDLLLHVIDVSHPQFEEQIGAVQSVLRELDMDSYPLIHVFNKVDLVEEGGFLSGLKDRFSPSVLTSASRGIGIERLKQVILETLDRKDVELEVDVPVDASKILAMIHDLAHVLDTRYEDGKAVVRYRTTEENARRIQALVEKSDGDTNSHRR
jgi:GTP-binding protein HflX